MKTRSLLTTLSLALLAGCTTGESNTFLSVRNETREVLAIFAFSDASVIDLSPSLPPGSFEENQIAPGRRLGFDSLPGYNPAKGVFLAIYVVQRQGAELTMTLTVSDFRLRLTRGLVAIDALPGCRITDFCATNEGRPAP